MRNDSSKVFIIIPINKKNSFNASDKFQDDMIIKFIKLYRWEKYDGIENILSRIINEANNEDLKDNGIW